MEKGYDVQNGVRPLRRLLEDQLEDPISNGLLEGAYQKGDVIVVSLRAGKLNFQTKREKALA